jgi:small subunit ribosomal protein S3e
MNSTTNSSNNSAELGNMQSTPRGFKSQTSKKHKIIDNGVFYAEIARMVNAIAKNNYHELDGTHVGVEICPTTTGINIIIKVADQGSSRARSEWSINQLKEAIQMRFNLPHDSFELKFAREKVYERGLSAENSAEWLLYELTRPSRKDESRPSVPRKASQLLRSVMNKEPKGCQVTVSGKLRRGQRAKTQKFKAGYMISTGHPAKEFIQKASRHISTPQGVMGIKVCINKASDATGKLSSRKPMPDQVLIKQPLTEDSTTTI